MVHTLQRQIDSWTSRVNALRIGRLISILWCQRKFMRHGVHIKITCYQSSVICGQVQQLAIHIINFEVRHAFVKTQIQSIHIRRRPVIVSSFATTLLVQIVGTPHDLIDHEYSPDRECQQEQAWQRRWKYLLMLSISGKQRVFQGTKTNGRSDSPRNSAQDFTHNAVLGIGAFQEEIQLHTAQCSMISYTVT